MVISVPNSKVHRVQTYYGYTYVIIKQYRDFEI